MYYLLIACMTFGMLMASPQAASHEVLIETGKYAYANEGLFPLSARRWISGNVYRLGLTLQKCEELSLDEVKGLLQRTIERFLHAVNTKKTLRPYLHAYPFSVEDVDVEVVFKKRNYEPVSLGNILRATVEHGVLTVYVQGPGREEVCHTMSFSKTRSDAD